MVKIDWSQVTDSGGVKVNWDDITGPQPEFAAGTKARMSEYEGLSPEQASQKYRTGQIETIKGIAKTISDPQKLQSAAHSVLSSAYGAIRHPGKTVDDLVRHYYENPDDLATDIITMAPIPEAAAAKAAEIGVKGAKQAAATRLTTQMAKTSPELAAERAGLSGEAAAIKGQAAADLEEAKGAGILLRGETFEPKVEEIKKTLDDMNYEPDVHTRAKKVLGRFEAAGKDPELIARLQQRFRDVKPHGLPMTWQDLHKLRRRTSLALQSTYKDERAMGMMMKDALDEYVGGLSEKDVLVPGNMSPQDAAAKFKEGLEGYSKASAAQEIDNLIERAGIKEHTLTQSGKVNALKQVFRQLALNPKKMRMFAHYPGAVERINELAKGGNSTQRFLMHIGKAAPRGVVSTGFDLYLAHAANSLLHGALGPLALPGIMATAHFAHKAAGRMATESAEELGRTILHGGEKQLAKVKEAALKKSLGSKGVFEKLMARPRTKAAIQNWINAKGTRKKTALVALSTAIAKEVGRPDLQQRIIQEIDNIDPEGVTTVPETTASLGIRG